MNIARPCYDKPHRCPGWAGSGWKFPKKYTCDNGRIEIRYDDTPYKNWKFGRCHECDVLVLPFNVRLIDPRWYIGNYGWRIRWRVEGITHKIKDRFS